MVENQKDFIVLWKKSFRGGIKVWQSKILYSDQTTIYSNPFEKYIKKNSSVVFTLKNSFENN